MTIHYQHHPPQQVKQKNASISATKNGLLDLLLIALLGDLASSDFMQASTQTLTHHKAALTWKSTPDPSGI